MSKKSQSVISGAIILVMSTVLVKVIGAVFKIPLTSLIGGTGRGYFSTAYNIYTPIYAISLAGLPTAVAKLVSQNVALGKFANVQAIRKVAGKLFFLAGTIGTLLLVAVAYPYAKYVAGTLSVIPCILTIAPSIFFCCLMSAGRGYFEGNQNMTPTAISQVIEALSKLVFGLLFAYLVMNYLSDEYLAGSTVLGVVASNKEQALSMIYPYTAAAAVLGVTAGTFFGWVYMAVYGRLYPPLPKCNQKIDQKPIAKELILIAMPIVLGSLVQNLSNLIDTATIQNRLEFALQNDTFGTIQRMYNQSLSMSGTVAEDIKTYLFGVYNSALDFKNLVPTVTLALGISALPAMSRAWTLKRKSDMATIVNTVIKYSMVVGTPIGFGMALFPSELLGLIYRGTSADIVPIAAPIVQTYGLFMFLFCVSAPLTSILQSIGKASMTVKSMAVGGVIKIVLNFVLVGNPLWNINGAPISTIACFIIIVVMNLYCLIKETKVRIQVIQCFFKPVLVSAVCTIGAKILYVLLVEKIPNSLALLIVITVSAIFYIILLIFTKILNKTDLNYMFKSEKSAKTLEKMKKKEYNE